MTSSQKGYSRLDRLFILLENGTTSMTRKAAAKQLGEVQKKYPHELNNLLGRLMTYIQHKEWDARIAGAEAIKAIVAEVPPWKPKPRIKEEATQKESGKIIDRLTFSKVDIKHIMNGAQLLLGSSGEEFESNEDEGLDPRERVIRARQRIERKMGLTVGNGTSLGVSSNDLFVDEDLITSKSEISNKMKSTPQKSKTAKKPCGDVVAQLSEGMSSREKNRAKRRAKLLLKQTSRDASLESESQPPKKKLKTEKQDEEDNVYVKRAPKHEPSSDLWEEWPFEWICEELLNLLFSPMWEWRHGACLALRDILSTHGSGAGISLGNTVEEIEHNNNAWLEDAAIRMLCVMVLDRFGDFVSDQVVAPVRESCAQALGILTRSLKSRTVSEILNVLLYLTKVEEWEVRHAGFLGIKYMLAAREDLHSQIVSRCIPALIDGLRDDDGDVKSVSAEALTPITTYLVETQNAAGYLSQLMNVLCNSLHDLDELTASTQSILALLSKLVSSISADALGLYINVQATMAQLWAFTQHSTPTVRKAALLTLDTLLNSLSSQGKIPWFSELAMPGLWSLAKCCVLESDAEIQEIVVKVWSKFCDKTPQLVLCETCQHYFATLVSMASQPDNIPYHSTIFMNNGGQQQVSKEGEGEALKYIGGIPMIGKNVDISESRSEVVTRTRQQMTRMLGVLCGYASSKNMVHPFVEQTFHTITNHILNGVNSRFALQRIVTCMILSNWWKSKESSPAVEVYQLLIKTLSEDLYFNEISSLFIQVQSEIKNIFLMSSKSFQQPLAFQIKQVYSLEDALTLCSELDSRLQGSNLSEFMECHQKLYLIANEAQYEHLSLQRVVRSYISHCLISASSTVDSPVSILQLTKLNPIIRPLMEGLKKEENKNHRNIISEALTHLLDICSSRDPCPNPKLIRNLCQSLKGDQTTFPDLLAPTNGIADEVVEQSKLSKDDADKKSILTLLRNHVKSIQNNESRKKKNIMSSPPKERITNWKQDNPVIAREGALTCIEFMCVHFKSNIFKVLPQLWEMIYQPHNIESGNDIQSNGCVKDTDEKVTEFDDKMLSLIIIEALAPTLDVAVAKSEILGLLPRLLDLIWCPYSAVRYICSRCLAVLTKRFSSDVMIKFVGELLPSIDSSDIYKRMGIIEVIANIIDCLKTNILPYTVLLIVPLLGRMSDQNVHIRLVATQCFASLIQYLPVESSVPDAPDLPTVLVEKRKHERRFLEQLLDSSTLDEYPIPVNINAKLRSYQQDGVKWMAFLNRYKLHGVLCDDMGLGKTLQSLCMLASDHYYRAQRYKETKDGSFLPLPSLVICPPTLTGHWVDEVGKFCERKHLNPLHYTGNPSERSRLQSHLSKHNLVIASYEVVRNDFSFFGDHDWNYCILDEGHMIRNGKSKLTMCVKSLRSNHRLILTGTPIQNSVLELWSLFDFLMPGFLGSEQEFNSRYSKPILASRDAKSSSKEQEEGVIAVEALHRQVLPFMLRRLKEDVLQDLPPKIIQDYYCNLSPLQVRLYEDFAKTKAKKEVDTSITQADREQTQSSRAKHTSHVFQALQYLQKVCNHPALVLTACHPEHQQVTEELAKAKSSLHDIQHSTKLVALKQLLLDCGIGVTGDESFDSVVGQHRALIFCQHKSMLDIVEHDLLRKHMKTVTFLRLDGSVVASSRHNIVSKFNNDPSIDLLLLTTKVGGLGLNLTGADTVIFIEHDWNPTVDLQAMDRAHRIGQKRVVNVYRLITRATLEEKILGLQQFKLNIANTVISTENSSLHSMGTNQLLDLFTIEKGAEKKKAKPAEHSGKGLRALMDNIGELWDQNQYDTEYNLDNFMEYLVS